MTLLPHTDFQAAFTQGHTFDSGYGPITVEVKEVAQIVLPSGEIVACDPSWLHVDGRPFSRKVAPGSYPVLVSLVGQADWAAPELACAMIRFSDEPPLRWENAILPDFELPPEEIFCHSVDSATDCYIDVQTAQNIQDPEVFFNEKLAPLMERLEWAEIVLDQATGGNLIAFNTHVDGGYPCYWGLNAQDQPVCLVTDFGLLLEATTVAEMLEAYGQQDQERE
jgi:Protein of unknown function (DUF4241)